MRLTEGLDSGPVALRGGAPIGADEDFGSLASRLAELGGELMVEALDRSRRGTLEFTEQDEERRPTPRRSTPPSAASTRRGPPPSWRAVCAR